ncbi:MAG: hypothetical protein ABR589_05785, partial [Chthoniobacterales bacterium]
MARARSIILWGMLFGLVPAATANAESKTVEERIAEYGELVRQRLEPKFHAAGVPYPPKRVTLIGIKQDRLLEVYA